MNNQAKFDRYVAAAGRYLDNGLITSFEYNALIARARRLFA